MDTKSTVSSVSQYRRDMKEKLNGTFDYSRIDGKGRSQLRFWHRLCGCFDTCVPVDIQPGKVDKFGELIHLLSGFGLYVFGR